MGTLYVIAGVYAFSSVQQSAVFPGLFLTVMVGVMWVVEGFASLFTLGQADSSALTIVFALFSIIAGFILLSSLVWGAVFLWWFLGISLLILGALNVIHAGIQAEEVVSGRTDGGQLPSIRSEQVDRHLGGERQWPL